MWKEVSDKGTWNDVVGSQKNARFLQSWEWGAFQKSWGCQVKRLSWNHEVLVQAVKMPLPAAHYYWYIPHGPIITKEQKNIHELLWALEDTLNDGALFYRLDPVKRIPPPTEKEKQERDSRPLKFVHATQPQCTAVLDITKSEDELLAHLHSKTRYNIRLAEKRGVTISEGSIEDFIKLNHETKTRDKFASHQDAYYQKMIASLPKDVIKIYQATYQNKVIASNIIITFGDTATYTHGTSSNQHRDTMAPYLLQWHTIQTAAAQHIKHYDFWGVNPNEKDHWAYKQSWEGITRFKSGFAGELVCYPYSFDVTFKPWLYRMYTLVRKLR
ncbi:hypothetical protein BK004_03735 [bacterium CG10_46_32]|nr:MAG: hypothetical protein BK004_03735 [bacterium CG10_46_32]PIR55907.1 MAG: hypothetical protein COU73_03765 [Parcubacteria group bacterium CG10_big_fil_rev_8_21_14_0_10_46_32]